MSRLSRVIRRVMDKMPIYSLMVHGALCLSIVIAVTILAALRITLPTDTVGLFGVILGVSGVQGAHASNDISNGKS